MESQEQRKEGKKGREGDWQPAITISILSIEQYGLATRKGAWQESE